MIRVIIFDYFDVFRADGYNRWLERHGYVREDVFLEASEKQDRGEYSDKQFFQAIAIASGETAEQVEKEIRAAKEINHLLIMSVRFRAITNWRFSLTLHQHICVTS